MDNKYDLTNVPNEVLISIFNYMLGASGIRISADKLQNDENYQKGFQTNLNFNAISDYEKLIISAEEKFKAEVKKDAIEMLEGNGSLEEYLRTGRYQHLKAEKDSIVNHCKDMLSFLRRGRSLVDNFYSKYYENYKVGLPVFIQENDSYGGMYIITKGNAVYIKPVERIIVGTKHLAVQVELLYSESKDKEFMDSLVASIDNLPAGANNNENVEE